MTFDFSHARQVFEEYLNSYDRNDEKIHLKIVHTYGVVRYSEELAKRLELSWEDTELARLIALLHDIGRFEQIRLFDSFGPETMDHAAYGVHLLFHTTIADHFPISADEDRDHILIRRFLADSSCDGIIETAIARHSDFRLQGITDERTLLHARLIRDADKLDNCRVKLVDSIQAMLGVAEADAGKGLISPKVWDSCLRKESVLSADRVTPVDYWASYLSQYYDLNFPVSFAILEEHRFIPRITDRLTYEEPDTAQKMQELSHQLQDHAHRMAVAICSCDSEKKGDWQMQQLFQIESYIAFLGADRGETPEPVHVFVAREPSCSDAAKFWITHSGKAQLCSGGAGIPQRDLRYLAEVLTSHSVEICSRWRERYGEVSYFC